MPAARGSMLALRLAPALVPWALLVFGGAGVACGKDTDLSASAVADSGAPTSAAEASADAGPENGITVTAFAPSLTFAAPVPASATWAAYRLDDGDWNPLAASAPGTYAFPPAVARWAVALVCASDDGALSTVFVHHRTSATTHVEVTLDASCTTPPPPAEFAFTGTLTNLPPTTQWLDFGYARTSRGDAIPVNGTSGTYEVVGIEPGTWDVAFGVRDEPFRALTRFVMRRGLAVKSDETIDLDVTGAGSFAPGSRPLVLHGLVAGDTVTPTIFYAAGGPLGIDVGPQDVPDGQPDVTLAYSTVPEASALAGDRYRGELSAEHDRRTGARSVTFDIHQPVDLDLTFLPEPPAPVVTIAGTSPYVRYETRLSLLANAERHEVLALASSNRRTQHSFMATYDALSAGTAAELVDTTPDLSTLPGWKTEWGLPTQIDTSLTVTAFERAQLLGDGKTQRSTSKSVTITP